MPMFSARLHVICIVDAEDAAGTSPDYKYTCDYPLVLLEADNEEAAFRRALELGKRNETSYKNSDGETVRWALRAVEHIWHLPEKLDGVEVGSVLDAYQTDELLTIDTDFEPESRRPMFSKFARND